MKHAKKEPRKKKKRKGKEKKKDKISGNCGKYHIVTHV